MDVVNIIYDVFNDPMMFLTDKRPSVDVKEDCPVCYNHTYMDKLECGHGICGICRYALELRDDDDIKCPLCRTPSPTFSRSLFTPHLTPELIRYIKRIYAKFPAEDGRMIGIQKIIRPVPEPEPEPEIDWDWIYKMLWHDVQNDIHFVYEQYTYAIVDNDYVHAISERMWCPLCDKYNHTNELRCGHPLCSVCYNVLLSLYDGDYCPCISCPVCMSVSVDGKSHCIFSNRLSDDLITHMYEASEERYQCRIDDDFE